uniref:Uncharacterized protein n=1 Tax=Cannabis sativa TaxID=3483 RepID=A0A803QCC6_CANSA
MSSKLRGLAGGPSEEPSGRLRAKVAQNTHARNAAGSSLPPPSPGPAPIRQPMMDDPLARRERPLVGAPRSLVREKPQHRVESHGAFMKFSLSIDNSNGSSSALHEQIKTLEAYLLTKEANLMAKGQALAEMEVLGLLSQNMISGLDTMLGTRNQENTMQAANISKLDTDLTGCDEKLRVALDGQQAIKDEKGAIREPLEANQITVSPEGSSLGKSDEEMADPPAEEVAGQGLDLVASQLM